MLFKELNLCAEVLDGIRDLGFEKATEIQQQAIPIALSGSDILATSATGSGKTAAFVVPLLHKMLQNKKQGIQALILAPTRELAKQIDEQIWSLGYHTGLTSVTVYGGGDWSEQDRALKGGVNIIVATPGRLMDHMKVTKPDLSTVEYLVLDEADRMLDMGFIPDVRTILSRIPKKRQSFMFSATMNRNIEMLAKEITSGTFERIKIGMPAPAKGIRQVYYKIGDRDKVKLLVHLYEKQKWHSAIVFASTKRGVDQLTRALNSKGAEVDSIHGDRDQKEREATLERFKSGKAKILVATDVMSRGIDVDNISHIINYDVPNDADDYIHRIGRTARAESTGDAITFVSRKDERKMNDIQRFLDGAVQLEEIPFNTSGGSDQRNDRPQSRSNKPAQQRDSNRGQSDNRQDDKRQDDQKDDDRKRDNRSRGRGRKPSGNRNENQKSGGQDQQKDQSNENQSKPKPKPRPKRKPRPKKQNQDDQKQNDKPRGKSGGRNQNNQNRGGRNKPANKKTPPVEEKHIRRQEKLIEQVQQSTMPKSKEKKTEESGGIWKKIKGIFD